MITLKWIRTRALEGYACPWYMGYAYRDFDSDTTVYYLVPLNIFVAFYKWLMTWIRFKLPYAFSKPRDYYYRGYSDGTEARRINPL